MASSLSNNGKNAALNGLAAVAALASAHTADPGVNGTANELAGGTPAYARKAITWGTASGGTVALVATFPVFDVPPATTVAFIGLWTAAAAYLGCFDTTDEAFVNQGTLTVSAGSVSL